MVGPDTLVGPIIGWHSPSIVSTGFIVMGLILATVLFRILYVRSMSALNFIFPKSFRIHQMVPESMYLIFFGMILGMFIFLANASESNQYLTFDEDLFFLFLIPPIILQAGYFIDQLFFFRNIWMIMMYAIFGTILCCLFIGIGLWGVSSTFQVPYRIMDMLLFAAVLSSVDPVAVLSVFEILHVNETLHVLVFGESILNDAASIVMYRLFEALRPGEYMGRIAPNLIHIYILLGIVKFLYVSIGGVVVGITFGLICSFVTKFTKEVERVEPFMILTFGYLSYFFGEAILVSGITSILTCGLIMARYVDLNISKHSHTAVKWNINSISATAEHIIFIYLGISFIVHPHIFDPFQILFSIIFIVLFRFLFIFIVGTVDNLLFRRQERRRERVGFRTMFIIAFGGLRGAIAFALAYVIPNTVETQDGVVGWQEQKRTLVSTVLIIILFTVGIQGTLMQPLLKILKIRQTKQTEKQLKDELRLEQNFLHHEEKEILQAVEKIEYLEKTLKMTSSEFEKKDFELANEKLMISLSKHIANHVGRIVTNLTKMNDKISNFMKLDAADKSNPKFTREIYAWRLQKISEITIAWREQFQKLNSHQRYQAAKNVNDVIQKLRSNLFKMSRKPTALGRNENLDIDAMQKEKIGKNFERSLSRINQLEYEQLSFVETLFLHDMIELECDNYYAVPNARDDGFLFYLDRTILLESLKVWKSHAEQMISDNDVSNILPMLKYLRKIIHTQTKNRLQQLSHLKKEAFAEQILGMGVTKVTPVITIIAKKWSLSRKIGRILQRIDDFIQTIVIRGLRSDEKRLVLALKKIRKDEMEEVEYRDLNIAYDEIVQGKGIKDLEEVSIRKEADIINEIILPDFLHQLNLKESPSSFIFDELSLYRKGRKKEMRNKEADDISEVDESDIDFSRQYRNSPSSRESKPKVTWKNQTEKDENNETNRHDIKPTNESHE